MTAVINGSNAVASLDYIGAMSAETTTKTTKKNKTTTTTICRSKVASVEVSASKKQNLMQ